MPNKLFEYLHKGPIENWHEAIMLGNGHMGSLIYGKDEIIISLDRIDLWDNRLTPEMKEPGFNYQNMVHTLKNDWGEYLRLFDSCYLHPYPTKLNAGSIVFKTKINKNNYFKINIKKSEFYLSSSKGKFTGYLDAKHDVLAINLPNDVEFELRVPDYLSRKNNGLDYPQSTQYSDGNFKYLIQKTKCGFDYAILTYRNSNVLLATVIKSKDIIKEIEQSKLALLDYDLKVNKKKHQSYWRKYFNHSSLITNEETIDRLYNFGRYFFACNSKKDYPMSLEGIWTANSGNLPPWKNDYHLDINLQMSYESYMKTGDFKEGRVLVDFLWRNRNKFAKFAKSFCNSDGYFVPGVMTQDCTPLGGWPMYALNPANSIWICSSFDNYYRYTGNESFLKNRAYPFFREVEKCISSLLIKNENGNLQFEFSSSPEIHECDKEAILKNQSNFELSTLHYLYKTLIDFTDKLKIPNDYYKKQHSKLADYSRNKAGEMMISKDIEYDVSHRHFSHILCHKNLENINPYNDYNQILKDYNRLEKYGHDEWVGFSFTEASQLASYIGLGEEAYKHIYIFSDGFINDNFFHMNMDFKHKGYSTIASYAFTLEANMGFVKAVTDMMLRTTNGIITIFPAIPQKFMQNSVKFKDLRSHNNHKISGEYKDKKLNFSIRLSKPDNIQLFNNIKEKFSLIVDGESIEFFAPLGTIIDIKANKIIEYKE